MAREWFRRILGRRRKVKEFIGAVPKEDEVTTQQKNMAVTADNPIQRPEDDALGRAKPAASFAKQLLALDTANGVVVGVLGPWGSGKTSFVNLAKEELVKSGAATLEFNPWMFSGAEQLVESFFVEISAQLKVRRDLGDVGKSLEEYGEAFSGLEWLPFIGPWIERGKSAATMVGKILERKKQGIAGRREKVEKALAAIQKPIIVSLDDIDRLTTSEIRDIFKLVRLTANFPNMIYIVAFDRGRVEQALGEQGIPGRDYLEKILQIAVDLPALPANVLNSQVSKALDSALGSLGNSPRFDQSLLPDAYMEVIRPLLRNMRDVRRYAAAVHGTAKELGDQIATVDLLCLEAVRVFLPDVFQRLHQSVEALTRTSSLMSSERSEPDLKEKINGLITASGEHSGVIEAMIQRLFPAAQRHVGGSHYGNEWQGQWIRERRVAHAEVLRYYLEKVIGEGLHAFTRAEEAWSRMTNGSDLNTFLRSMPREQLEDTISSLEAYEKEFRLEHAVPSVPVLLNILLEIPGRQRGMFDLGPHLVIGRVVFRLMRALENPLVVEKAAKEIIPSISSLSSKWDFILQLGHHDGAGHKLISEEAAKVLEGEWRNEVRLAKPEALLEEKQLLKVLFNAKRYTEPNEPPLKIDDSTEIAFALLKSSFSEVRTQSMGSRAVHRSPRLAWKTLTEVYGDESVLVERMKAVLIARPEGNDTLLQLAEKYIGGWRPKEFGEE
jgi:predicted KAP-like P-loop ATPase